MFFGKKKEAKTYSFEQMVEISTIKGLVTSCNEAMPFYPDKSYLTRRLEKIIHTEERWNTFLKDNPEFESTMMRADFDQLELTKKMLVFRIENDKINL